MKNLAMLIAGGILSALPLIAEQEEANGYTWTYRIAGDTVEIINNSYSAAISPKPTGAVAIPSTLGGKPVTSIGGSAFEGCSGLTSVTFPDGVTSIGDYAFSGCSGLTSVTIGNGVTSIGFWAFGNCSGLTSVTFPNGVTSLGERAFEKCNGLTSVTIPDGMTHIPYRAFAGCSGLTSVTIGNGVTSIGDDVFSGCGGLKSFAVSDGNPSYTAVSGLLLTKDGKSLVYGVNGAVTVPDSVTSIGEKAFSFCSGLTNVTIPDSVTSIGNEAFWGCSGLTSVTIGNGVTNIAWGAFSNTPFLDNQPDGLVVLGKIAYKMKGTCPATVVIPDGVTSIGNWAFSFCYSLTNVTIPDSVRSIADYAFYGCSEFVSFAVDSGNVYYSSANGLLLSKDGKTLIQGVNGAVTIPDSVTSIRNNAFYGCSGLTSATTGNGVTNIGDYAFYGCSGLMSVTISKSVTSIGRNAFYGCNELLFDTTTISGVKLVDGWAVGYTDALVGDLNLNGIRGIGVSAFEDCRRLTSVAIPNSVTSIGDWTFWNCNGLRSLTIPDSVTSIERSAFYGCSGLASVTFLGNAPTISSYEFFTDNSTCVIYVTPGSTGWGVDIPGTWKGMRIKYIPGLEPTGDGMGATVETTTNVAKRAVPDLWPETAEGKSTAMQGQVPTEAASVYDGFLYNKDKELTGTVQVKAAKPKDGKAKATVSLQPVGGKKTTVSGTLDVATGKVAASGLDLTLGADGMSGTWSGYAVSGSRNLFTSKSKAEQGMADAALKAWMGAVNVAWKGKDGWNGLVVNVAKKGKAKVSGTLASGAKVSANGQLVMGEEWCCVPVAWSKKGEKVAFTLWLPMKGGDALVVGLGENAKVGKPGTLKGGAKFRIDAASVAGLVRGAQATYLPDGVAVSGGAKWTLPKAGSVAYKNNTFDESKAGENPSGLKLTYKAKEGTFKGSFNAYALVGGTLKKTKVDVTGILVDGVGYGAATVKKVGGVGVTVE